MEHIASGHAAFLTAQFHFLFPLLEYTVTLGCLSDTLRLPFEYSSNAKYRPSIRYN